MTESEHPTLTIIFYSNHFELSGLHKLMGMPHASVCGVDCTGRTFSGSFFLVVLVHADVH